MNKNKAGQRSRPSYSPPTSRHYFTHEVIRQHSYVPILQLHYAPTVTFRLSMYLASPAHYATAIIVRYSSS
ncbi:hypothetical protein R70723_26745 [Paenibacillus sp. FSL R7-0273]|nr:hypothetical protein R70723_26745 [Paenibacillus sp. FSL R7-0273]OMF87215.1 hypothetical protein BK144_24605 [Paenibacillus sp. FSL R7-0273]